MILNVLKPKEKHPVTVEIREDGRTMAHVMDLPGCISKGQVKEEALENIPREIEEHCRWLKGHGLLRGSPVLDFELVETQEGLAPFESGDPCALFQLDLYPPDDEELEEYFRRMQASRQDLLNSVSNLPEGELKKDRGPGKRTIEKILWHIGHAEEWYISRLGITLGSEDFPGNIFEYLKAEREMAYQKLRSLTPLERATVYRIPEYTDNPDEPWTSRKALRRFLEHEREHTRNIAELLQEIS